jgi:glycosyltransferase involved in cell wall biosynthesis
MSKKVLLVSTIFSFHNLFERNNIKILGELGYEIHCASNGSKALGDRGDYGQIDDLKVVKHQIDFNRTPFSISNIKAYKQLKKLIKENDFQIIHCNTPVGGILGRFAAKKARKKGTKVIYTAHGFHFYKGASLKNWLIYYTAEKICSYYTDVLITINSEDYDLAKRKMKAKEIIYTPGVGINTKKFTNIGVNKEQKRKEMGISTSDMILLSVGELIPRKNHELIIHTLAKLNNKNIYYYLVGSGEIDNYLKQLAKNLKVEENVKFLGYRNDIKELCNIADIYCFPSIQEGLPVALMEAMACGLPVVCSNIRGNKDLVKNEYGGFLCNPRLVDEFVKSINILLEEPEKRTAMGSFNIEYIKNFDIDIVDKMMMNIYKNVK